MESVPLICVDHGDTESGDEAKAKRTDNAAHSNTQAFAVNGRKHLAGDDASNDSPACLHYDIEDTGNF